MSINSTNNQYENILKNENNQGVSLTIYPQRCPALDTQIYDNE